MVKACSYWSWGHTTSISFWSRWSQRLPRLSSLLFPFVDPLLPVPFGLSSHEVLVLNHWRCGQTTASAVDVQISSQIRTCYSKKASGMDTSSIKFSKPHSIPWFLIIVPLKWLGQTYIIRYYPISCYYDIPQHATIHFHTLSAVLLGIIPKSAPYHQTMQLRCDLKWPLGLCYS